ncbi:hypothetical protein [Streptomyces sp. 8L]|uniref:hypothetical protein n=1 Tax=Streptomyces sp. 8L TaxID=2877242 RepID=UPI001CD2D6DC|nr:hypothetical protein [Streptomyces sp. 8L]MCA1223651.1 hypothetical protein [Streptomyces sp. 8L]
MAGAVRASEPSWTAPFTGWARAGSGSWNRFCGDLVFSVSAQAYLPTLVPASRVMRANTALEPGDAAASRAANRGRGSGGRRR